MVPHYGRPPRAVHYMNLAREHARRSTCYRLAVGCLLANGKQIVSLGYNGPKSGEPHCTGKNCPGTHGCQRAVHAEDNAIRLATQSGDWSEGLDAFLTHSPCPNCLQLLMQFQVKRLFFETEFRTVDHLALLRQTNPVYQVTSSGYITNYFTKELVDPEALYD